VNLIGEHTDYNMGFVLPTALDMACYTAVAPGAEPGILRIYSLDLDKGGEWEVSRLSEATPRHDWSDYVIGVARQLLANGHAIGARDVLIHSTVPIGSGLSSSASLEISTALALADKPFDDKMQLVRIGHRAENEFVGMPCGVMDQYISVFGQENAAVKIDCRSLGHELVRLPKNVAVIAVNTMVKHELGSSAYRTRVAECAAAVEHIRKSHPEVATLRDATAEMITDAMPDPPRKRARHIVSENQRVNDFARAAGEGDLEKMGNLFVASHRSLQHDYEVSCEELDFLVDTAIGIQGVYGARMTGGGFGGCTVNLVDPAQTEAFHAKIRDAYQKRFQIEPKFYDCRPSAGAGPIS
jgi:galactokinase